MVLVCHETNDIFLEAAKVNWSGSLVCTPAFWLPANVTDLLVSALLPPAAMQMARYAKHEALTTAIFVSKCAACRFGVDGTHMMASFAWICSHKPFPSPFECLQPSCSAGSPPASSCSPTLSSAARCGSQWWVPALLEMCWPACQRAVGEADHQNERNVALMPAAWNTVSQERATALGVQDSIQPHHTILNGFLIFLYCLHIYWWAR